LRVGGLLHDIGKIGVRDTVLLKPGPLTAEERRLIEQHPTIGLQILESAELPKEVLAIVGGHHERLDGSGYPLGLSAEEISVFPRITAVADVYDALTTDRPYRAGMTVEQALAILLKEAEAGQMDPEVVATMQRIASLWEERRKSAGVQGKAWIESLYALGRAA
jgi:putative nucleotidyltransferase with HDIG domain